MLRHNQRVSLQPLLQPVEFLQRGEGCQVVDVEVPEFVHDGMLFRGEEGSLLFAFLFRGAFGDFGFARVVSLRRFDTDNFGLRQLVDQVDFISRVWAAASSMATPSISVRRVASNTIRTAG